jgi:hypothetical protein
VSKSVALRPHDLVRLESVIIQLTRRTRLPASIHQLSGHYMVADCPGDGVRVRRANLWRPPYDTSVMAIKDSTATAPSLAEDTHGHVIYLLAEVGGNSPRVIELSSVDDGVTWKDSMIRITNGRSPTQAVGQVGDRLILAIVGTEAHGYWISPSGESRPVVAKDRANGLPLQLAPEDRFTISFAPDNSGSLLGVFHIKGESELSDWLSVDDGDHWVRLSS